MGPSGWAFFPFSPLLCLWIFSPGAVFLLLVQTYVANWTRTALDAAPLRRSLLGCCRKLMPSNQSPLCIREFNPSVFFRRRELHSGMGSMFSSSPVFVRSMKLKLFVALGDCAARSRNVNVSFFPHFFFGGIAAFLPSQPAPPCSSLLGGTYFWAIL